MNLRTFSAATFAQAMALVKTELGGEAVILHTRTLQRRHWLGLRRREFGEITAGLGGERTGRPGRQPAPGAGPAGGGTGEGRNGGAPGRGRAPPAARPPPPRA